MSSPLEDSYYRTTTYNEVVRNASDTEELIERLYEFARARTAGLPKKLGSDRVDEAAAAFIADFMIAIDEHLEEHPSRTKLQVAEQVLQQLRQPHEGARIHCKAGFRRRILQRVLKDYGNDGPLARFVDEPDAIADEREGDEAGPSLPGQDDIPADVLETVRNQLDRALKTMLEKALQRVNTQTNLLRRRKAVIDCLDEKARAQAPKGVVSKHFESVVKRTKPGEILEWIRQRKIVGKKGRNRVSDKQLREDVRRVKDALRAEISSMKRKEAELRQHFATEENDQGPDGEAEQG